MLNYNAGKNEDKNWVIEETEYRGKYQGKTESIFLLGNGYMGIRSANEESTSTTVRNMFISGTFNKGSEAEVTELPNINDIYKLDLVIDGQNLIINDQTVKSYSKKLNLKTGLLSRQLVVENGDLVIKVVSDRIVSLKNKHVTAQKVKITANKDIRLEFQSMIDGRVTNSGEQHFLDGEKKLIENQYLRNVTKTRQSNICIATHLAHKFETSVEKLIVMDRRRIGFRVKTNLTANIDFCFEKYGVFTSSIDSDIKDDFVTKSYIYAKAVEEAGFDKLYTESMNEWSKYWNKVEVKIVGDDFSQLAIRFAQYQLRVNCPMHDERMNIGAKGLSGEGYKGHAFWDTELFMLPYFIFTQPEAAKKLVKYRYLGLEGARKKAIENNYSGAMYPWEAAWPSDGEVTPMYGAADVVTGEASRIWSGFIEQHITADVIYGLWLYYTVTGDQKFMNNYGYEMVFETANFWASRVEKTSRGYEIKNVIGPDEYKEHVDNNAYTNYMAKWNLDLALRYTQEADSAIIEKLETNISLDLVKWKDVSSNIVLQVPTEKNVLPQDDTYLSLEKIDLSKYKQASKVGVILEDYSITQVENMQVSKQADVLVLFLIMESLFKQNVKKVSFEYYEPKTLHDSSLSLSTHVVLANDLGIDKISEELFDRACNIDISQNMTTSDEGIHTASLGGIWQGVVYGFGGVRIIDEKLRIEPTLHSKWNELKYKITYKGQELEIKITKSGFKVQNNGKQTISFVNKSTKYEVEPKKSTTILN